MKPTWVDSQSALITATAPTQISTAAASLAFATTAPLTTATAATLITAA